jgi:hypothetical protein
LLQKLLGTGGAEKAASRQRRETLEIILSSEQFSQQQKNDNW